MVGIHLCLLNIIVVLLIQYIMNVLDEGRGNILSSKPVLTEGKLLHVFCAELCLLFYIFHII